MLTERCYYCLASVDRKQIKRCSRCTLVKYCSKECQILSWKTAHKNTCQPRSKHDSPPTPFELYHYGEEKALSRWINVWSPALQHFAVVGLDLANNPRDRNVTHCLTVLVKRRESNVDAKKFEAIAASVAPCAEVLEDFPQLDSVLTDPPTMKDERVRYVVLVQDPDDPEECERVRCRVWCQRNLDRFRNCGNKADMKYLAETFDQMLIEQVSIGDPKETERLMKIDNEW